MGILKSKQYIKKTMNASQKELSQALSELGRRMIQTGYVSLEQMKQAAVSTRTGKPLIDILQDLTGRPVPQELVYEHTKAHPFIIKALYGVEFVPLETLRTAEIFRLLNQVLPIAFCRLYQVLPIAQPTPNFLKIVMVEPNNSQTKQEVKSLPGLKHLQLEYWGIYQEEYNQLIEEYNKKNRLSPDVEIGRQNALDETVINIGERVHDILDDEFEEAPVLQKKSSISEESSIGDLVEKILNEAVEKKVSQIEIYPTDNHLVTIQFEEDGVFYPRPEETLSLELLNEITDYFKILAHFNPKSQQSQQARLRFRLNIRPVEFWLTISPDTYGEKISLRLLNQNTSLNISELIPEANTRQNILSLLQKTSGIILVTGTTRASVINTLYSLLSERNQPQVKIITVEDPIERIIPGLRQLEVERKSNSDHSALLNAMPAQDIDIIMIDDVSNAVTARIALEMALKGHLVLVGLAKQDCAAGITQLLEQDISSTTLAEQLLGALHNRYIRRLCAVCRLSSSPTPEQITKFNLTQLSTKTFYRANALGRDGIEQQASKGRLCRNCNGLGYRGLIDVCEVLPVNPSLKRVIAQRPNQEFLAKTLEEENLKPAINYTLDLAAKGLTTLEEVERIFPNQSLPIYKTPPVVVASSSEKTPSLAPLGQRIENIEKLLMSLLHEVQQLKQEANPVEVLKKQSVKPEPISSLEDEEELIHNISIELDPNKQTIASNSAFYEELVDPGEWEQLRNELNVDNETIAVDFSAAQEPRESRRSIPDPW